MSAIFLTTLGFMYLSRIQQPSVNIQFFLQNYFDILFISLLMYSSGGVSSGLGLLLLINIALLSQLASVRHSLMFAAIATIVVIGEEMLASVFNTSATTNLQSTALLGSLLFLTSWLTTVPLRRLMMRQLAKATNSRVVLDVRQIAQLNEEIIRELDSGVLVVDYAGNVQLMNDTARVLLAVEFAEMPVQLKKLSNDLYANMDDAEHTPTLKTTPFNGVGHWQFIATAVHPTVQRWHVDSSR